jgi:hypothetical protein
VCNLHSLWINQRDLRILLLHCIASLYFSIVLPVILLPCTALLYCSLVLPHSIAPLCCSVLLLRCSANYHCSVVLFCCIASLCCSILLLRDIVPLFALRSKYVFPSIYVSYIWHYWTGFYKIWYLGLQYALFDVSHFHFYICIIISSTYESEEYLPCNKDVELQSAAHKLVATYCIFAEMQQNIIRSIVYVWNRYLFKKCTYWRTL